MSLDDYFLGIDFGATKIAAVIIDRNANVLGAGRIDTPQGKPVLIDAALDELVEAANQALNEAGLILDQIKGIGVGVPGLTDIKTGSVLLASNLGWSNIPLAELLSTKLDRKGPIIIEKDTNAGAFAEYHMGAGRKRNPMLFIAIGTGIGGGIVIEGKLFRGASGGGGGFGHMIVKEDGQECACGGRGCLVTISSGRAIASQAEHALDTGEHSLLANQKGKITARDVANAARIGDAVSLKIFNRAAHYLGIALAISVNLLNPESIIIGGGLSEAGDLFLAHARETMRHRAFRSSSDIEVVPAKFGKRAEAIGVALLARSIVLGDE